MSDIRKQIVFTIYFIDVQNILLIVLIRNTVKLLEKILVPIDVNTNFKEQLCIADFICPVDFSEPSKRALTNAIMLAKRLKCSLRISGVYDHITSISPRLEIDLEKENAYRLRHIEKLVIIRKLNISIIWQKDY